MANEVAHIHKLLLARIVIPQCLYYRPWHYAYLAFFRQSYVLIEIGLPLQACIPEARGVGHPVGEVVLGQHGELGAVLRGGANEVGCFVEVEVGAQGLRRNGKSLVCRDCGSRREDKNLGM